MIAVDHFATLRVETVPCLHPEGTIVNRVELNIPHVAKAHILFPVDHYIETYPDVQIEARHIKSLNYECSGSIEGLLDALATLILKLYAGDVRGIITTRAEFIALREFLLEFTDNELVDIANLEDLCVSQKFVDTLIANP